MVNKFIFLDIDGVLNSELFYSEKSQNERYNDLVSVFPKHIAWGLCNIDPKAVKRLNRLVNATDAKIVVSSSWRTDSDLGKIFEAAGINGRVYGTTPLSEKRHRGLEIQKWLNMQTEPYNYVILDDDSDMLDKQLPYFIQTDWMKWGLSDEDVEQAIHILNDTDGTVKTHLQ